MIVILVDADVLVVRLNLIDGVTFCFEHLADALFGHYFVDYFEAGLLALGTFALFGLEVHLRVHYRLSLAQLHALVGGSFWPHLPQRII